MLFAMNRASAYDFEVDGMYYNIVSASDKTCSVTYGDEKYIGDVIIPEAVTYKGRTLSVVAIGRFAFENCSELKSITIPNSVVAIDEDAFEGCSALTGIELPNALTSIRNIFNGCSSLESITIPSSVIYMSDVVFKGCKALTNVIFEDGEDELSIYAGNGLFAECPLKSLYLGRNLKLRRYENGDKSPFYDISTLEKIVVGNKVTEINSYLFSSCSGITSIELSNSVISIGEYAFEGCSSLTNFVIPNSVIEIDDNAFDKCSKIETLIIEDGETPLKLGYSYSHSWDKYYNGVFCTPLKTLYWGRNITQSKGQVCPWSGGKQTLKDVVIGNYVNNISWFGSCSVLENMWLLNSVPPQIYHSSFKESHYLNLNVYVPQGSLSAYQNADVWKDFWNLQEGAPTGIESVKNITPNAKNCYYDLRGNRLSAPKRGLNIINGKKVIVK